MKSLLLAFLLAQAGLALAAAAEDPAATVIELSGEAFFEDAGGELKEVVLGQLFSEGDRLMTKESSSLQLVLADGSSLSLGPNTELSISRLEKAAEGSKSFFELIKGTVNAIIEKITTGSAFEIKSAYAVAAVKGTEFELSHDGAESGLTVREGTVAFSDPEKKAEVSVGPSQRSLAAKGALNRPFQLSKRDLGDYERRWERARKFHGQRRELMQHFDKNRAEKREALKARRERFKSRLKDREKKEGRQEKKEMLDRRKEARERFEKAREEIKKERKARRDRR